MATILRILLIVGGALFLFIGVVFAVDPVTAAKGFGLEAASTQGLASIRADYLSLFAGTAIALLWGAIGRNSAILLMAAILMGLAMTGRITSLIIDGAYQGWLPPLLVEATITILALLGSRVLVAPPSSALGRLN